MSRFASTIDGNPIYAERARSDAAGRVLVENYARFGSLTSAQISAMQNALGIDRTTLYEGDWRGVNSSITLQETPLNFEYVEVVCDCARDATENVGNRTIRFIPSLSRVLSVLIVMNGNVASPTNGNFYYVTKTIANVNTKTWTIVAGNGHFNVRSNSNGNNNAWVRIREIYGIHRIGNA
jgi:hypothetical protein